MSRPGPHHSCESRGSRCGATIELVSDHDWVEEFTRAFDQPDSAVQARIWTDVMGDEHPAELAPYSYTTRTELRSMADAVAVGRGDVLVRGGRRGVDPSRRVTDRPLR